MGLPVGNIPWLRGVGAIGAVAAMVTGGAVTTAGAIDDPGGAEPGATVQLMATDANGDWFSCDIAVDVTGSEPGAVSVAFSGPDGGAPGGAVAVTGSAVVTGSGGEAPLPAPAGAEPATVVSGVAVAGGADAGVPGGAEPIRVGDLPPLPDPAAVRVGTSDECGGLDVAVGEGVPIPVPAGSAPAGAGVPAIKATATDADGDASGAD